MSLNSPWQLNCCTRVGPSARISPWLILWIVGAWVRIASFSESPYPCTTSLDFSIGLVDLFFTSRTILVLKIRSPLCRLASYRMNWKTSSLASASISSASDSSNGLPGVVMTLSWRSLTAKSYESFSFWVRKIPGNHCMYVTNVGRTAALRGRPLLLG